MCIVFTLPNALRIFPAFIRKPAGSVGNADVGLFDIDALRPKCQEEIGAGIRIDDGLERRFDFLQIECGR